jgi:hypothetical protein
MSIEDVLYDMHTQLGRHGALLETISQDVIETKKEAKNTNGRVSRLELREEGRDGRLENLAGAYLQLKESIAAKPKESWFKLDWQKLVLIFGSIATLIALTIEKLYGK